MKETIEAINKVLPPFVQLTEQSPPADLWAALLRLYGEQVQGPKGHATWKDAALAELLLRTRGVTALSSREAALNEAWQAVDARIAHGRLPGDGTDKTAERNGMVLACNILVGLGARGIAAGVALPLKGQR